MLPDHILMELTIYFELWIWRFLTFLFFAISSLRWLSPQVAEGLKETPFKSLDDLIRHFKQKNQGLAMHLCHCVRRKTAILKKPQRQAEADKLGCLHQLQHASESKSQFLFFSTSDFPSVFWLIRVF